MSEIAVFKTVRVDRAPSNPAIAVLTLNVPERMNAFTIPMMSDLLAAYDKIEADKTLRVIVLTGAGRAFCAGADLTGGDDGESFGGSANRMRDFRDEGGRVVLRIHRCLLPTIAAINGPAVGFGMTMTLPADIRVAARGAKIGFVFARRGIVPEAASGYFLPRIVGISKALELCMTGRVSKAEELRGTGLFNYVEDSPQACVDKAMQLANEIATHSAPVSVALAKRILWTGMQTSPEEAHLLDSKCMFFCGRSDDCIEGVTSFLEKRPPKFTMHPSTDMPEFYPWDKDINVVPRSRM